MKTNQILALPPASTTDYNKPTSRFYLENAWPTESQEWTLTYEAIQR